ncbi:MAG: ribonuclease HI [Clostridiales bacterium]|nr:ribonuclease HI [Clostridiales bacterium]
MSGRVLIYTDGACSGNPGPGGWCAILKYKDNEKQISGGEKHTTNNRMELTAVIEGLKALKRPCDVTVISDSRYVCESISKGWIYNWAKKGWIKNKKIVPNTDLWREILPLLETHNVEFEWIRGHNGHPENELCDKKAVEESKKRH